MSEINKLPSVSLVAHQKLTEQKRPDEGQKFRALLKSAEVFSQEVDQMIQKAETDSVNGKVDTVGKTIDSLGEIASQMGMDKPHGPSNQQVLSRYEAQETKSKV